MTLTPWGPSETFREQRLRSGQKDRANGSQSARARLFGATVAVVAEQGYQRTSVADILEVAGVSRATFYRHFADKQTCVLATIDAVVAGAVATVDRELDVDAPWEPRVRAGLGAFADLLATYPAAAHLCLVDLWALGPIGVAHNESVVAALEAPVRRMHDESPAHAGMPPEIMRAIVGGIYKTLHGRVRRGEQAALGALTRDVVTWAIACRPPAAALRRPRAAKAGGPAGPQFAAHGQAGRLFAACVAEIAERGYAAVTIDDLARRAAMSLQTVYALFGGKEEVLLATYDAGAAQTEAVALPAFARQSSWPHGVRCALEALLSFLAGDPAWARMAVVETLAGGERAMERSDSVIDSYIAILAPGLERNPTLGSIALEATAGAIYTLVYEQVLRDPTRLCEILPLCTYVALAPFTGPAEALAVANDGGPRGRPRAASAQEGEPAPSA